MTSWGGDGGTRLEPGGTPSSPFHSPVTLGQPFTSWNPCFHICKMGSTLGPPPSTSQGGLAPASSSAESPPFLFPAHDQTAPSERLLAVSGGGDSSFRQESPSLPHVTRRCSFGLSSHPPPPTFHALNTSPFAVSFQLEEQLQQGPDLPAHHCTPAPRAMAATQRVP